MIYLDTSALLCLALRNDRGLTLGEWLRPRINDVLLTSVISEVTLTRLVRWEHPEHLAEVALTLGKISIYEVDDLVRKVASVIDADLAAALHVATATIVLGEQCQAFITYDEATSKAATKHHLPVLAPAP